MLFRLNKLQEISKKNQEKMQKDGIDVKRSASLSAAGIGSISTDNQFKTDRTNTEKFERAVENTKIVTVGSRYPSDGKPFLIEGVLEYLETCEICIYRVAATTI